MKLYIEKEFLFDFTLSYNEKFASLSAQRLFNFLSFPEIEHYIDEEITPENLEDFEFCFLKTKINIVKSPINIDFKVAVDKSEYLNQAIFLLAGNQDWITEATKKGALCFTLESYETEINLLTKSCHFKIDLSEGFNGWESFKILSSYTNRDVIITDNYLLVDKPNQLIDQNCGQLFKQVFSRHKAYHLSVFTRNLNEPANSTAQEVAALAIRKKAKLNSILANYNVKVSLTNNNLKNSGFFHDRLIITDHYLLESTKGFNLLPWTSSNAQILCESIFEKFTYKRIKNIRKKISQYSKEIASNETNGFKTVGY